MTTALGLFTVGDGHRGTSEAAWSGSGRLGGLPSLAGLDECRRVVVAAPHPDDEVLGAGGLLQALAGAGATVEICAVTDGEAAYGAAGSCSDLAEVRTRESLAAWRRLGLPAARRDRLRLPDGGVAGMAGQLEEHLRRRVDGGVLLLAPWRHDGHPDHDAVGAVAASVAAAKGAVLIEYLVWAWHWADPTTGDLPWERMARFDLDADQRRAKAEAILSFRSQLERDSGEPVLPAFVLERFRRPFEAFVAGPLAS